MVSEPTDGSIHRALRHTLAVVMAGGRGTRLRELTAYRSKPAVPFAGKYRIIDFTLSNCVNSGLRRICILTQYRSHSLFQHIERGWSVCSPEFDEFIEILPAQERLASSDWYQGTADAVYQNLDIIRDHRPEFVLVLAGDHIYKMDYGMMMAAHLDRAADVTVGCVQVSIAQAHEFGIMEVDERNTVIGFEEKPAHPHTQAGGAYALASMGIYLFDAEFLAAVLERDAADTASRRDFGRDIIPALYRDHRVVACPFYDMVDGGPAYWRDVGTIDAYWAANLEIAGVTPPLNLYDFDWPIRTAAQQLPPAKFVFDEDQRRGYAVDSLVSAGCIVSGAVVRHSVLSNDVRVENHAEVEDSVLLPGVRIGEACRIRRAIIDSGCIVPPGTVIGYNRGEDARRFDVTDTGVVLVCARMLGQTGSAVY